MNDGIGMGVRHKKTTTFEKRFRPTKALSTAGPASLNGVAASQNKKKHLVVSRDCLNCGHFVADVVGHQVPRYYTATPARLSAL